MDFENHAPRGIADTTLNRVRLPLARMGSNMDNAIGYRKQLKDREQISRRGERIPEWQITSPRKLTTDQYVASLARRSGSEEQLDKMVSYDVKRAVVIAGRRVAAVGAAALIALGVASERSDGTPAQPHSAPQEVVTYEGAPNSSTVEQALPGPEELPL